MAKQIIRLTEGDLHRIIENAVNKIMISEKWSDTYDKWADGNYKSREEGEKLNKQYNDELKQEFPDKDARRSELSKHCKRRDVKHGKTADKPYWAKYDKDMAEGE